MIRNIRRWLKRHARLLGFAIVLPACGTLKPAVSATDSAAQQACAAFVRAHPLVQDEARARAGLKDVAEIVDWYCSDPVILEMFRDEYLRGVRNKARRLP